MRGERYSSIPQAVFRIDQAATARAARERGHDSFVRASARARRPVTACPARRPRARPRRARSTGSSPASSSEAARPAARARLDGRDRCRPGPATGSTGRLPARAQVGGRCTGDRSAERRRFATSSPSCERPRRPRRRSRAAQELVAEPITLSFKDEDVGTLAPQRLAKLVRFRPDGSRFRVTFDSGPDREGGRAVPVGVAPASRQRTLRRRREGRADPPVAARPGAGRAVDLRLDLGRGGVIDPPCLPAPEADAGRSDDGGGRTGSGSASRSPRSRPTWAPRRRTASTTCS